MVVAFALAAPTSNIAIASMSECRPSLGRACDIYGSQRVRYGSLVRGATGQEAKGSEGLGQRAQLPVIHPTPEPLIVLGFGSAGVRPRYSVLSTDRTLPAGSLNHAMSGPFPRAMPFSSWSKPS